MYNNNYEIKSLDRIHEEIVHRSNSIPLTDIII